MMMKTMSVNGTESDVFYGEVTLGLALRVTSNVTSNATSTTNAKSNKAESGVRHTDLPSENEVLFGRMMVVFAEETRNDSDGADDSPTLVHYSYGTELEGTEFAKRMVIHGTRTFVVDGRKKDAMKIDDPPKYGMDSACGESHSHQPTLNLCGVNFSHRP